MQSSFTYAGGIYDRVMPLIDGSVSVEGLDFQYIPSTKPWSVFNQMITSANYDSSEMGLSPFIRAFERGNCPVTLLPIFPLRVGGRPSVLYVNSDAGIRKPEDLVGKKIGLPEYVMTGAIWFRGWLKEEFGLTPEKMSWFEVRNTEDALAVRKTNPIFSNISISKISEATTIHSLLETGDLDAAFLMNKFHIPSKIRRLFEDFKTIEAQYYRKYGLPINHSVALPNRVYEKSKWVTHSLYNAFLEAKKIAYERIQNEFYPILLWEDLELEEQQKLLGEDHWSYGFQKNKPIIERFLKFALEQGIISKEPEPEQLFAENTLGT